MKEDGDIQTAGFYVGGFLCLVITVLKLTAVVHWSWWRVMLPLWVILGHSALYIGVGLAWLTALGRGRDFDATIRPVCDEAYQYSAMLCMLLFLDNLLRRIGGPHESAWCWLASGRLDVIFLLGVLCLGCQVLFWSRVVQKNNS